MVSRLGTNLLLAFACFGISACGQGSSDSDSETGASDGRFAACEAYCEHIIDCEAPDVTAEACLEGCDEVFGPSPNPGYTEPCIEAYPGWVSCVSALSCPEVLEEWESGDPCTDAWAPVEMNCAGQP